MALPPESAPGAPPDSYGASAPLAGGVGGAGTVAIRTLDRELMRKHVDQAVSLDRAARAELGDAYSHESWTRESFLAERPGKWRLSLGAFLRDRLVGLLIASAAGDELRLHRLVVAPEARPLHVALPLMTRAERLARGAGLGSVSLSVSVANTHALAFYARMGYSPLRGGELRAHAARRGLPVGGDTVRPRGYPYFVLRKPLMPTGLC